MSGAPGLVNAFIPHRASRGGVKEVFYKKRLYRFGVANREFCGPIPGGFCGAVEPVEYVDTYSGEIFNTRSAWVKENRLNIKWKRPQGVDLRAPLTGRATFLPGGLRLSPGFKGLPDNAGGERGQVEGLSSGSRRRLLLKFCSIPWNEFSCSGLGCAFFLTLTYPDQFPQIDNDIDHQKIKRHLDNLGKRIKRSLGLRGFRGFVWRSEYKPRLSGENEGKFAPHFHLLIMFDQKKNFKTLARWFSIAWYQVCGKIDPKHRKAGTNLARVSGHEDGKLFSYLSKYMAKESDGAEYPGWTGRVWGVVGDLPQVEGQTVEMPLEDWSTLFRRYRKWMKVRLYDQIKSLSAELEMGLTEKQARAVSVKIAKVKNMLRRVSRQTINKGGLLFGDSKIYEFLFCGLSLTTLPSKNGESEPGQEMPWQMKARFDLGEDWERKLEDHKRLTAGNSAFLTVNQSDEEKDNETWKNILKAARFVAVKQPKSMICMFASLKNMNVGQGGKSETEKSTHQLSLILDPEKQQKNV